MSVFHNLYQSKMDEIYKNVQDNKYKTTYTIWHNYYSTVTSTFSWRNLPKTTLSFLPEEYLCYWGLIGFFKDDNGDFRILPCYGAGALLETGEYSEYVLISKNGVTYRRKREELALCYNNNLRVPSIIMINELSKKSAYALRAVDASLKKAILPSIIYAPDEQAMSTLADMYDEDKEMMPFRLTMNKSLKGDKDITVKSIYDNREIDIISQWDVYVRYRNLFYTTFGINNVEIQKRERLTEAEGSGNDEITRYTLLKEMYDRRTDFVNEIKEKFDYDMPFELNRDSATVYELKLTNSDKIENIEIDLLKGVNYADTNPEKEESKNAEEPTDNI